MSDGELDEIKDKAQHERLSVIAHLISLKYGKPHDQDECPWCEALKNAYDRGFKDGMAVSDKHKF